MIKILKRLLKKKPITDEFNPAIKQEVYFAMFDNGTIFVDRELTMKDFSEKLQRLEKGITNNNNTYGEA